MVHLIKYWIISSIVVWWRKSIEFRMCQIELCFFHWQLSPLYDLIHFRRNKMDRIQIFRNWSYREYKKYKFLPFHFISFIKSKTITIRVQSTLEWAVRIPVQILWCLHLLKLPETKLSGLRYCRDQFKNTNFTYVILGVFLVLTCIQIGYFSVKKKTLKENLKIM